MRLSSQPGPDQVTVVCYHWSAMAQFPYYGGYWYQWSGAFTDSSHWSRGYEECPCGVKNTNIQLSQTEKPDKGPHTDWITSRYSWHPSWYFPSPMIISLASWPGFLHNGVIDPSGVGSSGSRHPGLTTGYIYLSHMTLKLASTGHAGMAQLLLLLVK